MDLAITGRTALITGADSGIGFETARLLLAEGVRVVVSDKDADSLVEAAERLGHADAVHAVAADLDDLEEIARLEREVSAAVGDIDILVNSAGITGAQGLFHEIDDDGWVDTITTDLLAPIRVTRAFLPALRRGGWGRIVYLNSEDAVQPYDDELPYCAAKAGLLSFARGLARTYASEGLLVNSVSPAFIETPMTDAMMDKRADERGTDRDEAIETFLEEERPYMELGRRGRPEEVAAVIAFLCSDLASFVNGANYRVDSGSVATL
ncbi:SDR family NAD(P)-dependent oxidoreductase [Litorihabitans aurantiacus]|uniref:Ketoacyl reductase n=1 Tax=Litorihabitans aurantiacus TaxID=1930061 RepID=A0AA38CQY6_9MICO|nr:SDR family oxidoreductase [Litorihabitans aurantiacus]GMA31511.1 ketoacyl reductase [Litorihabitans aurantiacus]